MTSSTTSCSWDVRLIRFNAVASAKRRRKSDSRGPLRRSDVVARGSPVWAGGLTQDLIVQRLVRHQPFQPRILFLQLLQLTRHLRIHATVLRPPTIVRLFADPQLLTNLGNLLSLPQGDIRLTEHRHDLFSTMSLLHPESFPVQRTGRILSYLLDQVSGKGSP